MPGSPLEGDLRSLGFDVRTAPGADEARRVLADAPAGERVALVDARFVGHRHALRLALTDPRFPLSATTGAVTAKPEARTSLARALTAAGRSDEESGPASGGGTGLAAAPRTGALADRVAASLETEGADVHRTELGSLVAAVPEDGAARDEASRAVAAVDDEAVRLRSAVKARDGFFTTFFVSSYSRYIARWCARRGLTPNQVTTASLITAVIAAACAATGTRGGYIAAGALLYCSFVLDCTDGQLARYSLQYSTLGAWLDATFDRAKEYAYYAGLALGAARGGDAVWALALGAMVLQTSRHVVDFAFNEAHADSAVGAPAGKAVAGTPTAALSTRLDSVGWTVWVRRMIVLPIGERWAMIAVLTAVTTPRITFYALLIGCAFAACYTTAGRVLRSVLRRSVRTERAARALADLADSGPLARVVAAVLRRPARALPSVLPFLVALAGGAVLAGTAARARIDGPWIVVAALFYVVASGLAVARPLKGPLDWLVAPVFRAAEYGTVLLIAARSGVDGALPAAFGLVAAVAYHHYDTTYRIRGGTGAPPRWLVLTLGGHETRTLVVAALAAVLVTRHTDLTVALAVLAVAVALVALFESIRFWVSSSAPAVHDEGETA